MMGVRAFRALDRRLYRLIHSRLRFRPVDPIMVGATQAGSKSAAWLGLSLVLLIFGGPRARRAACITIASTLTSQAVVHLGLQPLFRRRRPYRRPRLRSALLIRPPRAHSWPSGHAASSAAAFTALSASYPDLILPLLLITATISYSRVYVGVHYPFDVAGGAVVGAGVGAAWLLAANRGNHDIWKAGARRYS